MKFTKIPISDKKYLNYIFLETLVSGKEVTTMFDTRGNSLLKQSIADTIDVKYIDEKYIDEKRKWRRARVNLRLGDLEIGSAPVIVASDESFNLMTDPLGNKFPADMILGWNIISQLCFRGDLRIGDFQVQIDDFRETKAKDKPNALVINVEFEGERMLASLDTSRPITCIKKEIFDKLITKYEKDKTMDMLDLENENLTYRSPLKVKIDQDEIFLPKVEVNPNIKENDVDIIFGVDLLTNSTWAMYNPMRYIRVKR